MPLGLHHFSKVISVIRTDLLNSHNLSDNNCVINTIKNDIDERSNYFFI